MFSRIHFEKSAKTRFRNFPLYLPTNKTATPKQCGWGLVLHPYHICSLINFPSISTVLILKSIPI